MKRFLLFVLIFLLPACAPAVATASPDEPVTSAPATEVSTPMPTPVNPYAPQTGDTVLEHSAAFMTTADLLTMESFPVQIMLVLQGNLPTPCHYLRAIVHEPDSANNIDVEIYSVANPNTVCVQVLQSFEANIPLGSYPAGHYTVSVNGVRIGEFDS